MVLAHTFYIVYFGIDTDFGSNQFQLKIIINVLGDEAESISSRWIGDNLGMFNCSKQIQN